MAKKRTSASRRQYQMRSKAPSNVCPSTESEETKKRQKSSESDKTAGVDLRNVKRKRKADEIDAIFHVYSPAIKLQRLECFETRYNADCDVKISAGGGVHMYGDSNASSDVKRKEKSVAFHPDRDTITTAYKPVVKIQRLKSLEKACSESVVADIFFSCASLDQSFSKDSVNRKRKADKMDSASYGHPIVKLQRLAFLERACSELAVKKSSSDPMTHVTDVSSQCTTGDIHVSSSLDSASNVTDAGQVTATDDNVLSHSLNSSKNKSFQSESDIFNSSSASETSRDSIGNNISSESSFNGSLNNSFSYLRELI